MAKTRKKSQKPLSTENLIQSKFKSQKSKIRKKKESNQTLPPNQKKKHPQKKVIVYSIVDDSIIEPKNTSIIYSEEDDSFHEIESKSCHISDKTSTPLGPKTILTSPKLLLKKFITPKREQVTNVSNILSNVSNIIKQISDSNSSFGILKDSEKAESPTKDGNNEKTLIKFKNTLEPTSPIESNTEKISEGNENKTYISQLNINLTPTDKNKTITPNNISNTQYDSFLQEFYLNANPHVISEKTQNDSLSWDQNVVDYSLEFSQMIRIDPSLADFVNAPGSIENKMKFLITRICGLIEENDCLKKHVEWLSDKYKQQNIDLDKQSQKNEFDILSEIKSPDETKKEYQKLQSHYNSLNNQLDEALRQKDNYKKSMLLFKAEKEAFENELIQLNDIEDDKLRMNELLNKQTALMVEIENIRGKNSEIRQDNKILKKEISDLKQDLTNANLIISDQRDSLLDQNLEIKNLEIFCNNQQIEIDNLTKIEFEPNNNVGLDQNMSKSWIEQVLDEYNDTDNQSNADQDLTFESISSNSLTENESEKTITHPGNYKQLLESEDEEISDNAFYNTNFTIRKFTGNEHFLPTLDPIKVKLRTKKSTIICKYFLRDMCNRGDECPYFHPFHPEEEFPNNPDILPSYKNQLRSIHNLNLKRPDTYHHSDQREHTSNPREFYPNYRGAVKKSISTPNQFSQNSPSQVNKSHPRNPYTRSPTPYLMSYPNSPTKNQPNPHDREYHSYGRNTWNPEKNEPCYYYLKGVCRYGSGCYFYHPQPNSPPHH